MPGRLSINSAPMTPFRLAGPPEFTTTCVAPALAGLVRDGLNLQVSLGRPAEVLLAGLAAGQFDAVISTTLPGAGVTATMLFEEEFVLIAAPEVANTIDRGRLAGDPGALNGNPFIAYADDLPMVRRYWRAVFETSPAMTPAVVIPNLRGILSLTLAGGGVTVLPRYLCREELRAGRLVTLCDPTPAPFNTIFLATGPAEDSEQLKSVRACLLAHAPGW